MMTNKNSLPTEIIDRMRSTRTHRPMNAQMVMECILCDELTGLLFDPDTLRWHLNHAHHLDVDEHGDLVTIDE